MRRRYSLVLGLMLIAAMLMGQASVSALMQTTPIPPPPTNQTSDGVQIQTIAYSTDVDADKNDVLLVDFTIQLDKSFPAPGHLQRVPSALFEVDSGFLQVTQLEGDLIRVNVGKNGGTPITSGNGNEVICETGWCSVPAGKEDLIVGPGDTISLTNSVITLKAVNTPSVLLSKATPETTPEAMTVKEFQGGGPVSGRGSVVQSSSFCWICPGH